MKFGETLGHHGHVASGDFFGSANVLVMRLLYNILHPARRARGGVIGACIHPPTRKTRKGQL
jgi:hypothetical protein